MTPAHPQAIQREFDGNMDTSVFDRIESEVRSYCRSFPTVFNRAKGAILHDETGRAYIDFFAGSGALNYGHNPDFIKSALIDYIARDGVTQALDMFTDAKRDFLEIFEDVILRPRSLDYKVQFSGPAGVNAVEAAMKLARLVTGRTTIAGFTGGWHGMTTAALSITGQRDHRAGAGLPLTNAIILPYPEGPYRVADTLSYIESLFTDPNSAVDLPAAIMLETIQAEAGVYAASDEWLRGLRALCDRTGVLMIVDDIQVGCGRTAQFFSFEEAGIMPDLVCLSKSISGYGLPMSLTLIKRDLDKWKPGQHSGTFRGNQLAFVAGAIALELWRDPRFIQELSARSSRLEKLLRAIADHHPGMALRGRGFIWALDFTAAGGPAAAAKAAQRAFELGLIVERCGRDDIAVKILPPIIIDDETMECGCAILAQACAGA